MARWLRLKADLGTVNLRGCKAISSGISVLDPGDAGRCDVVIYYETTVRAGLLDGRSSPNPPAFVPLSYVVPVVVARDLERQIIAGDTCEKLEALAGSDQIHVRLWIAYLGEKKADYLVDTAPVA